MNKNYSIDLEAHVPGLDARFYRDIDFHGTLHQAIDFSLSELDRGVGYSIKQFTGETWISIYDGSEIVFIFLNGKVLFHQEPSCSSCRHYTDSGIKNVPGYCVNQRWFRTTTEPTAQPCPLYEQREALPGKLEEIKEIQFIEQ